VTHTGMYVTHIGRSEKRSRHECSRSDTKIVHSQQGKRVKRQTKRSVK